MVVGVPSSSKSFHPLLVNCSSTANVHLQSVHGDNLGLPASRLHNCTGSFFNQESTFVNVINGSAVCDLLHM